jgi:hypothetical protein
MPAFANTSTLPAISPMRIMYFLLSVCIASCSSPGKRSESVKKDSLKVLDIVASEATTDSEAVEPNYRKEFIEGYSKILTMDTTFFINSKTYRVHLRHYCTWDNDLVVPAKYNYDTNSDFRTHNFESELTVLEGIDTSVKKVITKDDFRAILYPELEQHATLLFGNLKVENESIEVFYSISIPVTDLGIGAALAFDMKGKFTIKQ